MRFGTPVSASALRVQRAPLASILDPATLGTPPLGALAYGQPAQPAWVSGVDAPLLAGDDAMADFWLSGGRIDSGRSGAAHWRTDGHWMLGSIDLHEDGQGLEQASEAAYRDLFQALRDAGCPQLQRVWNYLPRINEDGGGLERYRQFNMGRQKAFIDAGHAVYEGAPAACALGVQRGALSIRFLAGQRAPLAIENPRQVSAYRYPSAYGPRPPTFSRAALAEIGDGQVALFISGTASIVGHATVHPDDVAEQTRETLRNLSVIVQAASERGSARYELGMLHPVVYVRHVADTPRVREVLAEALGPDADFLRHAVYLQADICRQDLLVEIEAHAVASGVLHA
ncbi:Rid family hydrolase [Variovorax sp. OV329]|uniref:chorismate transformation enzyme, FkbO/Hyg5 family n=1 Tax=Variovorax sp. OV329 TaxID=1882825 RepID=UPI0008EA2F5D|nr:Rid family hydrolase [Variovorax sp. OV329]SFM43157.1 Enamine deaminase RidA, house cleaning of reactive enamine intermediates, YjgF/YER057c/UK114 family [Variovorax sp. OV329]